MVLTLVNVTVHCGRECSGARAAGSCSCLVHGEKPGELSACCSQLLYLSTRPRLALTFSVSFLHRTQTGVCCRKVAHFLFRRAESDRFRLYSTTRSMSRQTVTQNGYGFLSFFKTTFGKYKSYR